MLVPSLPWQKDRFDYKNGSKRRRVSLPRATIISGGLSRLRINQSFQSNRSLNTTFTTHFIRSAPNFLTRSSVTCSEEYVLETAETSAIRVS
jgi:hypothetical protein